MKNLEQIYVSFYPNVYSKSPEKVSLLTVLKTCIQPTYASNINTIRRYAAEGDKAAAQKLKSKLPCFTPAGIFANGHTIGNLQQHSHIIGLDYDNVDQRLPLLRRCAEDPHTVAVLESPTHGLKVFAYVENIERGHRTAQQFVSRYYDALLGIESDHSCKDESRLCYVTYSPNGYIATLYEAFVLPPESSLTEMPQSPLTKLPPAEEASSEASPFPPESADNETIERFISSYIFLNPMISGKRHTNLFKLACEACKRGFSQEVIFRHLLPIIGRPDFEEKEILDTLSSGYKQVNRKRDDPQASPFSALSQSNVTKGHSMPPEQTSDADEAYWTGEELRTKTPDLPDKVYENLPTLIEQCIPDGLTQRERSTAFLSVFTALSAALPCTFGMYNKKRFSPHIYSVIIAPAGSGKSIAQIGRYLLSDFHEHLFRQSIAEQKAFKKAHDQWTQQLSTHRRSKSQEPIEIAQEPEEPPFRMLIIPASTSYTRMQRQLQDNGSLGGIIIDTEAQTLSTANHRDCGNFDDMLRKAFEHENIDSLYKANGIKPISIRHPKLAMLLTGTPAQLDMLLSNSENGLGSRTLFFTFREVPQWKEMGEDAFSHEEYFKELSLQVSAMAAFCEKNPVQFSFTSAQWKRLNATFSHLLSDVVIEGHDEMQAVVKRYAFLVMRLSMIQTRIRQFESQTLAPTIVCNDTDFERSLQTVLCCYEHSRLLLKSIPSQSTTALKNPDEIKDFIESLPHSFTTEEAIEKAEKQGIGRRKTMRILRSLINVRVNKLARGLYQKTHLLI